MRRTHQFLPLAAAALAGSMLPMSASYAVAPTVASTVAPTEEPPFSGYAAEAWAAPVKIEVYEPTIPIPATPQAELELGYTVTEATTGLLKGRASHVWPGDPVGSGFATFGEAFGLPPQLYENGYPVQVNSEHPGGPEKHGDEPFPGVMMRTSASAEEVTAVSGLSPDGRPSQQGDDGGAGTDLSDPTSSGRRSPAPRPPPRRAKSPAARPGCRPSSRPSSTCPGSSRSRPPRRPRTS